MRVELHRVSHDIGHLIVAPVVEPLHRVEYAALHGFEAVAEVRHGTLEDNVRGIIEKPVLIHAGQLQVPVTVFHVGRLVRRMCLFLRIFICAVLRRKVCIFAHGKEKGVI